MNDFPRQIIVKTIDHSAVVVLHDFENGIAGCESNRLVGIKLNDASEMNQSGAKARSRLLYHLLA
jgi:hypothetical protein